MIESEFERSLKEELTQSVYRNLGDSILLSGGLDSSIIAVLVPKAKVFTVTFENCGSDSKYARLVAEHFRMEWHHKIVKVNEAMNAIPEVIRILKTFDPAIPNDIATYFGIKLAKGHGCKSLMTGDGGDELFAGYDYMHGLDLDEYIPKIAGTMSFNSNVLGHELSVEIKQPYLDRTFVEFAVKIPPILKVRNLDGITWGKWILRKAFEDLLPKRIVWRKKTAIEFGSGFTKLRDIIENHITAREFEKEKKDCNIEFRNREHLYYYEIYKREVGAIPEPCEDEKACKSCGAGLPHQTLHCRICGGYPV